VVAQEAYPWEDHLREAFHPFLEGAPSFWEEDLLLPLEEATSTCVGVACLHEGAYLVEDPCTSAVLEEDPEEVVPAFITELTFCFLKTLLIKTKTTYIHVAVRTR
jgi:hypothetical protein